jgi:hypothetical protein
VRRASSLSPPKAIASHLFGLGVGGIMYDEPDDKIILTNHSRVKSAVDLGGG